MLAAIALVGVACSSDRSSGTSSTTTVPRPAPAEVAAALCGSLPEVIDPVPVIQSTTLTELSGLVASRQTDDLWWAHNDSGHQARLHAVGPNGENEGSVVVNGAASVDWEDLSVGPGPQGDVLYIADTGNNIGEREIVTIDVVPEPESDPAGVLLPAVAVERTIELEWPDGPRDAETLLIDPRTSQLVILTKTFGGASEVYAADGLARGRTELRKAGVVDLRDQASAPADDAPPNALLGLGAATSGDVTIAGDAAIVRTYGTALVWPRQEDQTLAEAIVDNEPCEAATTPERQGEAIALDPDGLGYRTIGEGNQPPVHRFLLLAE